MATDNERIKGLDILKILLSFGVIMSHKLYNGTSNSIFDINDVNCSNFSIWLALYLLVHYVDNIFAFVSGYISKPDDVFARNNIYIYIYRIIKMWIRAFVYCEIVYIIFVIIGIKDLSLKLLFENMLPVTFCKYWYFTCYFMIYLFKPFIDRVLDRISISESKIIIFLIFVFSFISTLGRDPFETKYGYSLIWILLMYVLGFAYSKSKLLNSYSIKKLFVILIVCFACTWYSKVYLDINKIYSLISPISTIITIVITEIFSRINDVSINYKPLLNTLNIYMFDGCLIVEIIREMVLIDSSNVAKGVLMLVSYSIIVFLLGTILNIVLNKLLDKSEKNLSMLITNIINRKLSKL